MSSVSVLIVVDAFNALATGNLQENVYLVDTNKYFGSGNEGQAELQTACADGQIINWRITPVAPDTNAVLTGFTGQIITESICNPVQQGLVGDEYWSSRVETQGKTGTYQYSAKVTIDGREMTFDPFLVVKT
jgi:hypothetical protein